MIIELITKLQNERRENKIVPDHVPHVLLFNTAKIEREEFNSEIERLLNEGKIGKRETINQDAYYVKTN